MKIIQWRYTYFDQQQFWNRSMTTYLSNMWSFTGARLVTKRVNCGLSKN